MLKGRHVAMAALVLLPACGRKTASAEPARAEPVASAAGADPVASAAAAAPASAGAAEEAASASAPAAAAASAVATGGSAPDRQTHPQAQPADKAKSAAADETAKPVASVAPAATSAAPAATAAPAPPRTVRMVSGSGFSEANFAGTISAPSPVSPGKSATATVSLSAKAPFHCNDKYPYKFTADAPSGVSYPSSVVRGMSVAGTHASMGVPFVAGSGGRATIAGTLSFSVCSTDKCLMQKRHVSVTIDVD